MARSPQDQSDFPDLSGAVRACGTEAFQATLSKALAQYLSADRSGILQYSRYAIPHYLLTDHVPEEEVTFYLNGAYRFDPFLHHWRTTKATGLLHQNALSQQSDTVGDNARDYILRFQPQTGMEDEIALLCPKIGDAVDNYFFLRDTPFQADELATLRRLFPTIQELHALNQRLLLSDLGQGQSHQAGFPEADAFAIDDHLGRPCFASRNWQRLVGSTLALSDAVEKARKSAPGQPILVGSAHVISEVLEPDFPPAPNGRITFVVERPMASPSLVLSQVVEDLFADRLTQREISICHLILRGYPSTSIAEKLGIATGTVKNHRKSIYRKLDITTEREMFLMALNTAATIPT